MVLADDALVAIDTLTAALTKIAPEVGGVLVALVDDAGLGEELVEGADEGARFGVP